MSIFHRLRAMRLRSSALVGLVLIVASVIGVNLVIRANNAGTPIVLAAQFLPAGTVVTDDLIKDARVVGSDAPPVERSDLVGRVLATDVGAGELVSARVFDESSESKTTVAIPLGVTPATTIATGSTVTLWEVDEDGVRPPVTIAERATVLDISDGSLGSETQITVLLRTIDVDRVLGAVGSSSFIVVTAGQVP